MTKTNSTTNPFGTNPFGANFSKLMEGMKMPSLDFEQGMQTVRRNVEAMTAANQLAIEGCQALMRRQMEIVKNSMQEASSMMSQLTAAGTPEDKITRQVELMKQAYENTVANAQELQGLVARSHKKAAEVISTRVCDTLDEIKTATKKAAKGKQAA